jgi:hypothetical protein
MTVILAAILVVLALAVVALAWTVARARQAVAPLALAHAARADARAARVVESLVRTRTAAALANSGAERALWAVNGFDARAERLEAVLRGHRQKLDETTILVAGMGGKVERLRSVAALVFGR